METKKNPPRNSPKYIKGVYIYATRPESTYGLPLETSRNLNIETYREEGKSQDTRDRWKERGPRVETEELRPLNNPRWTQGEGTLSRPLGVLLFDPVRTPSGVYKE